MKPHHLMLLLIEVGFGFLWLVKDEPIYALSMVFTYFVLILDVNMIKLIENKKLKWK